MTTPDDTDKALASLQYQSLTDKVFTLQRFTGFSFACCRRALTQMAYDLVAARAVLRRPPDDQEEEACCPLMRKGARLMHCLCHPLTPTQFPDAPQRDSTVRALVDAIRCGCGAQDWRIVHPSLFHGGDQVLICQRCGREEYVTIVRASNGGLTR